MRKVYMDFAATSPIHPEVVEGMMPYLKEEFGNPSSLYSLGSRVKKNITQTRHGIADILGCSQREIIFTSCGTESDNLAIKGIAFANKDKGRHIITSQVEHPAVLNCCALLEKIGWSVTYISVDKGGKIDPELLAREIKKDTVLISIMHANNEIGTIQPIAEIAKIAREKSVCFHVDGVQTFGKIPVVIDELGPDLFSISAHKIAGPKGAGVLYVRRGTKIMPLCHGGGQEYGLRSGTENVPGIIGMGIAAKLAADDMCPEKVINLRNYFLDRLILKIPNIAVNGTMENRLPNNIHISIDSAEGEAVMIRLDSVGVACSTGSACSSTSSNPSHVLSAIGLPKDMIKTAVRFTMGSTTTREDINYLIDKLEVIVNDLRAMSPS